MCNNCQDDGCDDCTERRFDDYYIVGGREMMEEMDVGDGGLREAWEGFAGELTTVQLYRLTKLIDDEWERRNVYNPRNRQWMEEF